MGTDVQFTELKRSSMMNEKLPILCCLERFAQYSTGSSQKVRNVKNIETQRTWDLPFIHFLWEVPNLWKGEKIPLAVGDEHKPIDSRHLITNHHLIFFYVH